MSNKYIVHMEKNQIKVKYKTKETSISQKNFLSYLTSRVRELSEATSLNNNNKDKYRFYED